MTEHESEEATNEKALSMSALGKMGRFGNQLLQYAFLTLCAERAGVPVECPEWVGSTLFGRSDKPISGKLRPAIERVLNRHSLFEEVPELVDYIERMHGCAVTSVGPESLQNGISQLDLYGFFQFHTRHYRPYQREFRNLFCPVPKFKQRLDESIERARKGGRPLLGLHIRQGDYLSMPRVGFTLAVPPQWYADWARHHLQESTDDPILFICSDQPHRVLPAFSGLETTTSSNFDRRLLSDLSDSNAEFYADFYTLTQCDAIVTSNSTFSFVAAMLNERAKTFVRPTWDLQRRFSTFDPWDSEPLLWPNGDESRFFKSYRDMLHLVYETQGNRGLAKCLGFHLPLSHARESIFRSFLAWKAGGIRGLSKRLPGFRKLRSKDQAESWIGREDPDPGQS